MRAQSAHHRSCVAQRAPSWQPCSSSGAAGGPQGLLHRTHDLGEGDVRRGTRAVRSRRTPRATTSPVLPVAAGQKAAQDKAAICPGAEATPFKGSGRSESALARSTIAITAYRPFVLSCMIGVFRNFRKKMMVCFCLTQMDNPWLSLGRLCYEPYPIAPTAANRAVRRGRFEQNRKTRFFI